MGGYLGGSSSRPSLFRDRDLRCNTWLKAADDIFQLESPRTVAKNLATLAREMWAESLEIAIDRGTAKARTGLYHALIHLHILLVPLYRFVYSLVPWILLFLTVLAVVQARI